MAEHIGQGLTPKAAEHLAAPYPRSNMGHHFVQRSWEVPESVLGVPLPKFAVGWRPPEEFMESPLNVLKPPGLSRSEFYKLHYRVDPSFYGAKLPGQGRGGGWSGRRLGLQKEDALGRLWYGSPPALKATVGSLTAGGRFSDNAEQWGGE